MLRSRGRSSIQYESLLMDVVPKPGLAPVIVEAQPQVCYALRGPERGCRLTPRANSQMAYRGFLGANVW